MLAALLCGWVIQHSVKLHILFVIYRLQEVGFTASQEQWGLVCACRDAATGRHSQKIKPKGNPEEAPTKSPYFNYFKPTV